MFLPTSDYALWKTASPYDGREYRYDSETLDVADHFGIDPADVTESDIERYLEDQALEDGFRGAFA